MTLVRRSDRSLSKFQDAMGDLFNQFFEGWDIMPTLEGSTWWPMLDIADNENEFLVKVEVPGMKAQDINVSVQGNVLTLTGKKEESQEDRRGKYYHTERRFGEFRREFTLPSTVDSEHVEATCSDGVLTISLPKTPAAKTRKIEVREHALTR